MISKHIRIKKARQLNILILSDVENYANKQILSKAKELGHKCEIASPNDFSILYSTNGYDIFCNNESLEQIWDVIIPRLHTNRKYGTYILDCLLSKYNILTTSSPQGLNIATDKILTALELSKVNIPQPRTINLRTGMDLDFALEQVGGLPCIAKTLTGSQGKGVYILESQKQSKIMLSNMLMSFDILLQEYIETAKPNEPKSDIRAWVVGGKVVAAFQRFSTPDDVRSNYSISKKGGKVELTKEETETALKCAKTLNLSICGVDIARPTDPQKGSHIVYEVNGCADLRGIETVTNESVAEQIIFYCEILDEMRTKNAKKLKKSRLGQITPREFEAETPKKLDEMPITRHLLSQYRL